MLSANRAMPAPGDLRPSRPDSSPLARRDHRRQHLVAEARAQGRAQIADAVGEAERHGRFAGPVFAGEQEIVGALQPRAAALLHQRDEDRVDLALDRLQPRDVVGVFRQERIEHRLVLARRIEPALDADLLDQLLVMPKEPPTTPIEPRIDDGSQKISSPAQAIM